MGRGHSAIKGREDGLLWTEGRVQREDDISRAGSLSGDLFSGGCGAGGSGWGERKADKVSGLEP